MARLPPPAEAAALAVLACSLISVSVEGRRWAFGAATLSLAVLLFSDQLRWQPWAYHGLLVGVVLWSADRATARTALRIVAVAVYGWSALAKLDAEFAATLGSQLVGVVAPWAGPNTRFALAFVLPVSELVVAALLAVGCWRRPLAKWACGLAVAMHAVTILALSPLGLGHSMSVLLWNAGFAWQTWILFWPGAIDNASRTGPPPADRPRPFWRWPWRTIAATTLAAVVPVLTPFERWDAWLGWALYAPRLERAQLFVRETAVNRLPEALRRHVGPIAEPGGWRSVDLDAWVLEQNRAPIYPANRIVATLAADLAAEHPLADRLAVAMESAASPLSGERRVGWLDTADAFREAARWAPFRRAEYGSTNPASE